MLGFIAAIITELVTGEGLLQMLILLSQDRDNKSPSRRCAEFLKWMSHLVFHSDLRPGGTHHLSEISKKHWKKHRQEDGKGNQLLAKTDCRTSSIILESLDLCLQHHCDWATRHNRAVLKCDAGTHVRPSGDLGHWPDLPTGDWSHPRHREPDLESPSGSAMAWRTWHTPRIACNLTQCDDERSTTMSTWTMKWKPGTPWVRLKTPPNRGGFIHSPVDWWSSMGWSRFLWCSFLNGWRRAPWILILQGQRHLCRCGPGPGALCRNFVSLPWQWLSWGFWHAKWCCSTTRWTAGMHSQLAYFAGWEDIGHVENNWIKIDENIDDQGVNSNKLTILLADSKEISCK